MGTYLDATELAQHNIALAMDIMNAAERLWPLVEATRDPIESQHILDILQAANRIKVLNRAVNRALGADHMDDELKKVLESLERGGRS